MIIAAAHDLTRNHSVLRPVANTRATAQVQASQMRRAGHAQEGFDEWLQNPLCQDNANTTVPRTQGTAAKLHRQEGQAQPESTQLPDVE